MISCFFLGSAFRANFLSTFFAILNNYKAATISKLQIAYFSLKGIIKNIKLLMR
jgi:hypothetical protein